MGGSMSVSHVVKKSIYMEIHYKANDEIMITIKDEILIY